MSKKIVYGGLRIGKSELARLHAEAMLDAGKTVYFAKEDELRGAGVAKDVTPKPRAFSKLPKPE